MRHIDTLEFCANKLKFRSRFGIHVTNTVVEMRVKLENFFFPSVNLFLRGYLPFTIKHFKKL